MHLRKCLLIIGSFYFIVEGTDVDKHPNWKYLPENCGKAKENQFRIYGGQEAQLGEFPWMVRLRGEKHGLHGFVCGAALIGPRHILTAAHCQEDVNIVSVRIGEYDTKEPIDCDDDGCAPEHQDIEVEYFRAHPEWSTSTLHNDIAVVKLVRDATFNDYVQPICLPGRNTFFKTYDPTGSVKLAGWGYADNSSRIHLPHVLQFVNLPVKDMSYCSEYYPKYRSTFVANDQLCIGSPDGKDTCEGDSGGPVMQEIKVDNEYRFHSLGVVSFGSSKCGEAPAIYTNVRAYLKWILDNL
ncbi:CLIP domain-containing serine protease HP8-like [Diorhabda sublineata]|uniref:CLIP domain-containing serine protease HP8-like n=1 Tax=Diorhabda sublineata TaxID=1163346 RepID=UPI0024E147BC|nr:CLIP domain-containing serine protease HP8-like [Diorhabda sublineata]